MNNMKKLKTHGEYPEVVYRTFDEKEYAEEFVNFGKFRLGHLRTYKDTEDLSRKDVTEGVADFHVSDNVTSVSLDEDANVESINTKPGLIRTRSELGNPVYLLCTSMSGVEMEHISNEFGKYIVKINNPRKLAEDITSFLETMPHKFAGGIEGQTIKYNKGHIFAKDMGNIERTRLSYSQKPEKFSKDNEFRFIAIIMDRPSSRYNEDYLYINIGKRLEYTEIIKL